MNIYAKLTLLCLALVIVSSSILFVSTNYKYERAFRDEIQRSTENQSRQVVGSMERFIYSRLNEIEIAAANPIFLQKGTSGTSLFRTLQGIEKSNGIYHKVILFSRDGRMIKDSHNEESVNLTASLLNVFTSLTEKNNSVLGIEENEASGKVSLVFASATPSSDVLVGYVYMEELSELLGSLNSEGENSRKSTITLYDQEGSILFPAFSKSSEQDKWKGLHKRFLTVLEAGGINYETENEVHIIVKQKGYRDYKGNNWMLVVSHSKQAIFEPLIEIKDSLIWILLPVLLGSVIMALIIANYFVRPIVRISYAAIEIGKGNLDVDIPVRGHDEIGKLGKELKLTSQTLIRRIQEQRSLNQKLEEQKNEIALQKEQIELKGYQITDSISYANRIQKSLLPDIENLRKVVPDAMVFYSPKDIVSGDFYWFERVRKGRNDFLVIACADCTGHGVPGAIMSIMGSNQLTNVVYYQNYLEPQKILARLDKAIKLELYRGEEEGDFSKKDGIEMGLCVINLDDYTMEYSGVGIPLYLQREGKLEYFRCTKGMIGGMEGEEREVESQIAMSKIELKKGDRVFLSSDGFQDQFGGPKDKKYMAKNFRSLLQSLEKLPLYSHSGVLQNELEKWKGQQGQTDDIVIIGAEF